MINIFRYYRNIDLPADEILLARKILSARDDKTLLELYYFHLALNAEKIDPRLIEKSLSNPLRTLFREAYNISFLLLKIWKSLVKVYLNKALSLPNLYLPEKAERDPYYYYRRLLRVNQKRIEKRWKEILFHLSPT